MLKPYNVTCSDCGAKPGVPCATAFGLIMHNGKVHPARMSAFKKLKPVYDRCVARSGSKVGA